MPCISVVVIGPCSVPRALSHLTFSRPECFCSYFLHQARREKMKDPEVRFNNFAKNAGRFRTADQSVRAGNYPITLLSLRRRSPCHYGRFSRQGPGTGPLFRASLTILTTNTLWRLGSEFPIFRYFLPSPLPATFVLSNRRTTRMMLCTTIFLALLPTLL